MNTRPDTGHTRSLRRRRTRARVGGVLAAWVAVSGGIGALLLAYGGGTNTAEAQPIPCEQWQQMHPGWPCIDVPTYSPQPQQPTNTGPAPVVPTFAPPTGAQGGNGGGAGALTPPPLQAPPNMNNPIVPVPGYVPPVLPGNEGPPAPQAPQGSDTPPGAPAPETPAAPGVPQPGGDLVTQLQQLAKLHADGVLSDQEFAAAKQRLLQATPSAPPAPMPTAQTPDVVPKGSDSGFDPRLAALLVAGSVAFIAARPIGATAGQGASGNPLIHPVKGDPTPPKDPNPVRPLIPGTPQTDSNLEYSPQGFESYGNTEWVPDFPGATTGTVRMGILLLPRGAPWTTSGVDVWIDGKYQHIMPRQLGSGEYLIEIPNVRLGQKIQFSGVITGMYRDGKTWYEAESDIKGTFQPQYSVRQRLAFFYQRLGQLPPANTADEAFNQIATTLDAVEDEYSGVPRNPNPGKDWDGRMYPPREDYTTRNPDGSITARTAGSNINIGSNGSIEIIDRKTGTVEFSKPGGGA